MTVGGWFDAEDLYGPLNTYRSDRGDEPRGDEHPGDGAVVPRRLGSWRRGLARAGDVLGQDRRVLPGADRVPVLRAPPEAEGRMGPARGVGLRDGPERVAPARPLAAKPGPAEVALSPAPRAGWPSRPRAGRRARRSTNSSATRPAPSRTPPRSRSIARTPTWSRTSGSPPDVPTCWSTRPEPLTEDVTVVGPIRAELHVSTTGTDADWVVKLIDVYPDDYPDPEPNPPASAWAATSNSCGAR